MNDQTRTSVTETMAQRFGMTANNFEQTLRATVMPQGVTREQFAAFLLVARDYNLNPITREIHAFPRPGGGIQPIVGIDGWYKLINSHAQMNGLQFEDLINDQGELWAIKARIHHKDRQFPTEVTEYMTECRRNTEPWRQWPARMLRHKAVIQCARAAFGFSGIQDPDEFERWTEKTSPAEPRRTGKRAMAREFKRWESASGPTPETEIIWDDPKPAEASPVEEEKAVATRVYSQTPQPPDVESAADAHAMGREARRKNAKRDQWPAVWRDQVNLEAWLAGWDAEDEEAKAADK